MADDKRVIDRQKFDEIVRKVITHKPAQFTKPKPKKASAPQR